SSLCQVSLSGPASGAQAMSTDEAGRSRKRKPIRAGAPVCGSACTRRRDGGGMEIMGARIIAAGPGGYHGVLSATDLAMSDFAAVHACLRELQDRICAALEGADGGGRFQQEEWTRP